MDGEDFTGVLAPFLKILLRSFQIKKVVKFISSRELGDIVDGNATGLLGELVNNITDVAFFAFVQTPERFDFVKFSPLTVYLDWHPISLNTERVKPISFMTMVNIFDEKIWIGIVLAIFFFTFAIQMIELIRRGKKRSYFQILFEVLTDWLRQGIKVSKSSIERVAWTPWFLGSFCITSAFTGVLLSINCLPDDVTYFEKVTDISKYPGIRFLVSKSSAGAVYLKNHIDRKFRDVYRYADENGDVKNPTDEYYAENIQLLSGTEPVAILVPSKVIFYMSAISGTSDFLRTLHLPKTKTLTELGYYAYRKDFDPELEAILIKTCQSGFESGFIMRTFNLMSDIFLDQKERSVNHDEDDMILGLRVFRFPFWLLGMGLFLFIPVFVYEFKKGNRVN